MEQNDDYVDDYDVCDWVHHIDGTDREPYMRVFYYGDDDTHHTLMCETCWQFVNDEDIIGTIVETMWGEVVYPIKNIV